MFMANIFIYVFERANSMGFVAYFASRLEARQEEIEVAYIYCRKIQNEPRASGKKKG